jgi:small subunit ribosomal protein S8
MNEAILSLFKKEGFIKDFKPMEYKNQGLFRVYLKYAKNGVSAISNVRRISRPGLRNYVTKDKIPSVFGGLGLAVISTSKGVMTSTDAKESGVGGEVLLYIW